MENICKVCGNEENNRVFIAKELMYRIGASFRYLECSWCMCLKLIDVPSDMEMFYGQKYYSFSKKMPTGRTSLLRSYLRDCAINSHLGSGNILKKTIGKCRKLSFSWLVKGLVEQKSKILDVGCGNGALLFELSHYKFERLYGIDAFISAETERTEGIVKIKKTTISGYDEENFDLIMYHHSFEHLEDPLAELRVIRSKLSSGGCLLLRMPIANSFAFRKYRQYWVQLDAPRHVFVHSVPSVEILCQRAGLKIDKIVYDSNAFQFAGSECYLRDKPLSELQGLFSSDEAKAYEEEAKRLNLISDGDSACFYISSVES